ncbi:hypothetical protein WJX81_000709 [Elliptochloris bilobata]|uniref:Uncharacterized protein n=1 Tax=Elliptochloris bilobata TaxID=381761 RepID=A0AAW1QTN7_9CHLO
MCPENKVPAPGASAPGTSSLPDLDQVLFVEAGWGCDQHGQNVTKAAVRACRNAIEFNSLPAVRKVVPGGYDNLRLHIKLGSPRPAEVDVEELRKVFPYGKATFEVVEGGLSASSGVAIPELGDTSDEMVIAVVAVTAGYSSACASPLETPTKGYGYESD